MPLVRGLMKRSGTARALYLTALLQLVGGPVILCGIVMLAKLTASHAHEENWMASFHATCESREMAAIVHDLTPLASDEGGPSRPSKPAKVKTGFAKMLLAGDTTPQAQIFVTAREVPFSKVTDLIPKRAHAPPAPPPRLV